MIAPEYPPEASYVAPTLKPYSLSLGQVSVAELAADPEAWGIVTRHVPSMKFLVSAPGVKELLDNMTVLDFGVFGVAPPREAVIAADTELARLPSRGALR